MAWFFAFSKYVIIVTKLHLRPLNQWVNKLSRKAWNNVIIFSMLDFDFLLTPNIKLSSGGARPVKTTSGV